MHSEVRRVSEVLSRFDKDLFCKVTDDGVLRVYHHKYAWRPYDVEGETYLFLHDDPYHVFSFTDSWGFHGNRANYGSIPLWNKLRQIEDRERVFEEIRISQERSESSREREDKNLCEAMAFEMRDAIKKDTNDVLTHSLDTKKDKRRDYEKFYKRSY